MASADEGEDKNIEQWKIRRLIKSLEEARGNGTSMISLILPPKDDIARANKMLGDEFGTAQNIKSRVNRLSVLSAIKSTQERLKLYHRVPPFGLVVYCGTILTEDNKEKKVTIDFEPFKPINTSLYLCDNKFHTEALQALLASDQKFGFIIMDGNGTLFGTLSGNTREIIHKVSVELPKKHGRGGQSAMRFARLRLEKRHNYVVKIAELSNNLFLSNDKINVSGLILAGSADFKNVLSANDVFDARLQIKILAIVDIAYGGENGFNQAIELSAPVLGNVKFIQEKKILTEYFERIAQDLGTYCFGIDDTLKALEMGAVETLLCWEDLPIQRVVLLNPQSGDETVKMLTEEQLQDDSIYKDDAGLDLEIKEKKTLVEWLCEHYKDFGAVLEFVTNKSTEGSQFCRGFGGIGGLMRYKVDFMDMEDFGDYDDDDEADEAQDVYDFEDCFI
jgi:peptide chain release factor subunit 1